MKDHLMYVYVQHKLLLKIIQDMLKTLFGLFMFIVKVCCTSEGAVVATETNF